MATRRSRGGGAAPRAAASERDAFRYRPRNREQVRKRAQQKGGMFDPIFKDQFAVLRVKEGTYQLRLLPPTWPDPEHYGFDIYVHYSVGPDQQSYLCLDKMKGERCPVCEERRRLEKAGETDAVKELTPTKRVVVYVVDRDQENEGPLLYSMPWTQDRDLAALSEDQQTREILCVDDPEEGYDVVFTRQGSGIKTKYVGLKIARKSTPLSSDQREQDDWLDFVVENPVPDTLNFYDAEYIKNVFAGEARPDDEEELPEEERPRRRARREPEEEPPEEERPRRRARREPEEEPEEERPRRRGRRSTREEEEELDDKYRRERPPRRREREPEPEPEEERPTRRRARREPEEEERPRRRASARAVLDEDKRRDAKTDEDEFPEDDPDAIPF